MESIGLMPSDTGSEGGKRTGPKMTHYIIPGDLFDTAADQLLTTALKSIGWALAGLPAQNRKRKIRSNTPARIAALMPGVSRNLI